MPIIDETVVINRPAEEVFDFLMQAENLPRWDSSMLDCAQLSDGPVTLGTQYRGATKVFGRRFDWKTQVEEHIPNVHAKSRAIEGSLKFTVTYDLTPVAEGTQLHYQLAAESGLGGAFGRAMEPLVEKAQTKVVRANLVTLAALLERRAA